MILSEGVWKKTERRGGSLCGSGAASSGAGGNDKYAAGKYSGGKSRTASGVGVPCEIHHSSGANLSGRGSCVSGASYRRSGVGGTAGGTFQEFADSIVNQCVHPDDLQQVKRLRDYGVLGERLMSMDGSFELEIRVWTKDHYRWMRLQFVMAEEKNGSPQVVVLSVRDIDTVKKQQEQLKEAMEFAQEQAERANRAKSIFYRICPTISARR